MIEANPQQTTMDARETPPDMEHERITGSTRIDLTGIFEAYGTCDEFPRTHGNYLGISRAPYSKAFLPGDAK